VSVGVLVMVGVGVFVGVGVNVEVDVWLGSGEGVLDGVNVGGIEVDVLESEAVLGEEHPTKSIANNKIFMHNNLYIVYSPISPSAI